jgi:hypothetical protein
MSQVNANSYYDASGASNAVLYGVAAPANSMGFRNRIINGDMRIDQRNAGASINPTDGQFVVDRFSMGVSQTSKLTAQRSTTAPAGFTNSVLVTSSSAYSVLTSDYFAVAQVIEGLNVSDLGWGTANAQAVTVSFWVRSSLTGTFGGSLRNSAGNRSYPFSYTISAANTWELETITSPGDTTGTWLTDNSAGIRVWFALGVGSTYSGTAGSWAGSNYVSATGTTSVVGTSGATFYITGVQLEAGSVASPFERLDYGRSLIQCQRYCQTIAPNFNVGYTVSNTVLQSGGPYVFPTVMRAAPTLTGGAYTVNTGSAGTVGIWYSSTNSVNLLNASSNWTVGANAYVSTAAVLAAEL